MEAVELYLQWASVRLHQILSDPIIPIKAMKDFLAYKFINLYKFTEIHGCMQKWSIQFVWCEIMTCITCWRNVTMPHVDNIAQYNTTQLLQWPFIDDQWNRSASVHHHCREVYNSPASSKRILILSMLRRRTESDPSHVQLHDPEAGWWRHVL